MSSCFALKVWTIVPIFALAVCVTQVSGQNDLSLIPRFYKESAVTVGYNFSFAEPHEKNFHLAEIGVWNSRYSEGGEWPFIINWNYGVEIGLNTPDFLIGPKFGGFIGFLFFIWGSEFVYYSDFDQGTLRWAPYLGIGYKQFKLTVNPHIRLTNTDFEPIDRGQINLTIPLLQLHKEIQD